MPLTPDGLTSSWDGTMYVQSTCGPTANACSDRQCAAAGSYIARMCAYPRVPTDASVVGYCEAGPTPNCVDVPFEYPYAGTVSGTLTIK
jgi:hypothetical protein